jgi:hypothetical protein
MSALAERFDRFVRWFFISSPTTLVESRATTVADESSWLRRIAIAAGVAIAMVILVIFYAVVSAAVEHAANHRADEAERVVRSAAMSATRIVGARVGTRSNAVLLARAAD